MLRKLLNEPLLHFLALGIGVFLAYKVLNPTTITDSGNTIVVTRDGLLNFIQYRAKRFDAEYFEKQFDAMPADTKAQLINNYVREEALYREAKALGLDKNDYTLRRRLVQQLEFVTTSLIDAQRPPSDQELQAYYQTHQDNYRKPAEITFTHVFVATENPDDPKPKQRAQELLSSLQQQPVPFHHALSYGDRFLYHRNYVRKEADTVASHFGHTMQTALFALTPSDLQWHGPFQSPYGWHLAMVTDKTSSMVPPIQDIAAQVLQDAMRVRQQTQLDDALATMVNQYRVEQMDLTSPKPLYAKEVAGQVRQ